MHSPKWVKNAYFNVYMHQNRLRMPSWDYFFGVLIPTSSPAILKKLRIYQRILILIIERRGNESQICSLYVISSIEIYYILE